MLERTCEYCHSIGIEKRDANPDNMSFLYAWCQFVCNVFKFITIQKSDSNSSHAWSCERQGKLFNNPFLISVCLITRCVIRMATFCTLDSALDEKGGLITKHRHMHSHCLRASRQHQFSSSLEAVFETSISCTLIHTTQNHFWHSRSPFPRIKFPSRGWHHPQQTSKDCVGLIRGEAAWGIYNFSGLIKHPLETERTTYSCHKSPQVLSGIKAPVDWTLSLEQTQTASSRYQYPTSHCCVPNNSASSWRFSNHFWN
jgi:hypothetical protein